MSREARDREAGSNALSIFRQQEEKYLVTSDHIKNVRLIVLYAERALDQVSQRRVTTK